MKPLTLLAAALALATACVGEFSPIGAGDNDNPPLSAGPDAAVGDDSPDAGDLPEDGEVGTARALFDNNVRPIISATCSPGGACHSAQTPAFVAADPANAYTTVTAYRDQLYPNYNAATATLLANGSGAHYGATFAAADVQAIQAWLAAEALEAQGGGATQASPLAVWSGCMNYQDWIDEGVADAWADKNAGGAGNCDTCHNLGADGFIASNVDQRVFDVITQNASFMPSYFTLDATATNVIINRTRLESVGLQQAPHQAHGSFDVNGDAMDRLQRFYDRTLARQAAGTCDSPRF